jgi:hypothetical protein
MAGKPRVKRVMDDLTLLATAELAGEVDSPTALDYVQHYVENGGTMMKLAAKLQATSALEARGAYDPPLEGGSIARMLRRTFGEAAVDEMLARARARGSHALVESTHDIADEPVLSSEDASRARNRIGSRQWAATAYARDVFGQRGNNVNVQVNLGAMHIDALRRRTVQATATIALDPLPSLPSNDSDTDDVSDDVPTT